MLTQRPPGARVCLRRRCAPPPLRRHADRALASAAARRADAAATRHLALALQETHPSLRKRSAEFEEHYQALNLAVAALETHPRDGAGRAGGGGGGVGVGGGGGGSFGRTPALPASTRAAAQLARHTPTFAPASCPPLLGVHAWAAQFEDRLADGRCVARFTRALSPRQRLGAHALTERISACFLPAGTPPAAPRRWTCSGRPASARVLAWRPLSRAQCHPHLPRRLDARLLRSRRRRTRRSLWTRP
jgi:hypothetical protein